jgi:anti-sigma-K factor RskA
MSDHPARELLPGYSLGCLEEAEEREVRAHVAVCPTCRDELAALQEVTGSLALALPPATPPAGLEDRIRQSIVGLARASRAPRAGRARSYRVRALGAVAAVLIVALGAGNILQLSRGARGPQAAASLTTAVLKGTEGQLDAYGTIVLDPEDNHGVLAVRGLHRLDAGHQYQLWLIKDTERRSGGVFSVNADGYGALMLEVPPDFKGFRSMGISVEPTGGSPAPTGAAVMRGTILVHALDAGAHAPIMGPAEVAQRWTRTWEAVTAG